MGKGGNTRRAQCRETERKREESENYFFLKIFFGRVKMMKSEKGREGKMVSKGEGKGGGKKKKGGKGEGGQRERDLNSLVW